MDYAGQLAPFLAPPSNPAHPSQPVKDMVYGSFVQPLVDAYKGITGKLTETEARDFALTAAMGLIAPPMAKGVLKAAPTKGIRAYHGSPRTDLVEIKPSERGPFGPATYFSPAENVAQRYAGASGKVYGADINDTFHGLGGRYLESGTNPYDVWRAQGAKLIDAAPPELRGQIQGLLDKNSTAEGYELFGNLSRLMQSKEAAQGLLKKAGFGGVSGYVDGPEVAKFGPVTVGVRAYHGSPHDFDKFSLDKIGTGEGAQSYGHGLYFAENEGVAKEYRRALAGGDERLIGGAAYKRDDPAHVAAGLLHTFRAKDDARQVAIQELLHDIDNPNLGGRERDTYKRVVDLLQSGQSLPDVTMKPRGRMYEVNINAHPDQFLDWDKPLAGQSPVIKDAFGKIIPPPGTTRYLDDTLLAAPVKSGGAEYKANAGRLYQQIGLGDQSGFSQKLNEAGIPGIKYLDQGSRAAGEGSRNFVVFDPSIIDILKKYGLAGATVGGGAAMTSANYADPLY